MKRSRPAQAAVEQRLVVAGERVPGRDRDRASTTAAARRRAPCRSAAGRGRRRRALAARASSRRASRRRPGRLRSRLAITAQVRASAAAKPSRSRRSSRRDREISAGSSTSSGALGGRRPSPAAPASARELAPESRRRRPRAGSREERTLGAARPSASGRARRALTCRACPRRRRTAPRHRRRRARAPRGCPRLRAAAPRPAAIELLVRGAAIAEQRRLRVGRDLARQSLGDGARLTARRQSIGEADRDRLLGADRHARSSSRSSARERPIRRGSRTVVPSLIGTPNAPREDAEDGGLVDHAQVAPERDAPGRRRRRAPSIAAITGLPRDPRGRTVRARRPRLVELAGGQLAQVGAGAERAARPGEHRDARLGVALEGAKRARQLGARGAIERVATSGRSMTTVVIGRFALDEDRRLRHRGPDLRGGRLAGHASPSRATIGGITMRRIAMRLQLATALALLTLARLPPPRAAAHQHQRRGAAAKPTFYREVLPILQENCQECHRTAGTSFGGQLAPMGARDLRRSAALGQVDREAGRVARDAAVGRLAAAPGRLRQRALARGRRDRDPGALGHRPAPPPATRATRRRARSSSTTTAG